MNQDIPPSHPKFGKKEQKKYRTPDPDEIGPQFNLVKVPELFVKGSDGWVADSYGSNVGDEYRTTLTREQLAARRARKPIEKKTPPINMQGELVCGTCKKLQSACTCAQDGIGCKFDEGKLLWELLPYESVEEIVKVVTYGATKYAPNNWKNLPNAKMRYMGAMMRHITAWFLGESHDKESGIHHLAHAGCCILFLLWVEKHTALGQFHPPEEECKCKNH